MKRLTALLLSALLIVSLFSGCTSNELGFYQTVKSINALKSFNYSGSVAVKINNLQAGSSASSELTSEIAMISSILENASVTYGGNIDTVKHKISLDLKLKTGDGSFDTDLHLILDNGGSHSYLYISKDIASMVPAGLHSTPVTVSGIQYERYDIAQAVTDINAMQLSQPTITNPYNESTQKALYDAYVAGFNEGYQAGYDGDEDDADTYTGDQQAYEDGYEQGMENATADSNVEMLQSMVPALQGLMTLTKTTSVQQDFQNKLSSLVDTLMNTYFKNLTLGVIKKSADSTYSSSTTVTDLCGAFIKVLKYISSNPDNLKAILTDFAENLSNAQVEMLGIDSVTTQQELVDKIQGITASDFDEIQQELKEMLSETPEAAYLKDEFSLKKTGLESYDIMNTLNFNNNNEKDADFSADLSVVMKLQLNSGSTDIGSAIVKKDVSASDPTLALNITDPGIVETGILVSTHKDMSSFTRLKGTESAGHYVVDLSSLKEGVTYYYQVYTVDSIGNLIKSKQIAAVKVPLANPDTGEHSSIPAVFLGLGLAAAFVSVSIRRKALNSAR
ncbi:MAG: LPXTG cell wall anchor domain-containing protein [Clostridia bacterium]|nr:LPXTG cell wall anchor domain-containing protein [Clostridia bacterium]